jgi:hypothetical protein
VVVLESQALLSLSIFMTEVTGVFHYFSGFPAVGLVGLDVGYQLCSVDIGIFFFSAECLAITDFLFSTLISLMNSELPVEMLWPVWPSCIQQSLFLKVEVTLIL